VNWFREFEVTELAFIAAFLVAYGLYLFRVISVAKKLKTSFGSVFIKVFLRTIYFALFIIAIMGPSFGGARKEVKSIGKDIMICVDLSKSMDAFDIQPSRLEKVKNEMKKVVAAFNSDRIGVIIFGNEAFMQCPLTFDQNALNLFIETINTSLVPTGGTDFGPPLRMAIRKFKEDKQSGAPTSKIVILISDGEDFGEETDDAVREIEDNDVRLFTLGVGTAQGGNIYASNGLKKDKDGNIVTTKLNASSLKSIAAKADGQYFEINESRNDVNRMINTISKIEGELRDTRFVDVSSNKYFYFLAIAMALFSIDVLLNIKIIRL